MNDKHINELSTRHICTGTGKEYLQKFQCILSLRNKTFQRVLVEIRSRCLSVSFQQRCIYVRFDIPIASGRPRFTINTTTDVEISTITFVGVFNNCKTRGHRNICSELFSSRTPTLVSVLQCHIEKFVENLLFS